MPKGKLQYNSTNAKWLLPQPTGSYGSGEFIPIPFLKRSVVPFGYEVNPDDPFMLLPIPDQLKALEQAKEYLKRYPSNKVAAWLVKKTGRSINGQGLLGRVKSEQKNQAKAATARAWARRYKAALQVAEKYDRTLGQRFWDNLNEELERVPERLRRSIDCPSCRLNRAEHNLQTQSGTPDSISSCT